MDGEQVEPRVVFAVVVDGVDDVVIGDVGAAAVAAAADAAEDAETV